MLSFLTHTAHTVMWLLKDTISKLAVNLCYLSRKKQLTMIREKSSLLISIEHFLTAFSKIHFFSNHWNTKQSMDWNRRKSVSNICSTKKCKKTKTSREKWHDLQIGGAFPQVFAIDYVFLALEWNYLRVGTKHGRLNLDPVWTPSGPLLDPLLVKKGSRWGFKGGPVRGLDWEIHLFLLTH